MAPMICMAASMTFGRFSISFLTSSVMILIADSASFGRFSMIAVPSASMMPTPISMNLGSCSVRFASRSSTPCDISAMPESVLPVNSSVSPSIAVLIPGINSCVNPLDSPCMAVCISCRLS